MTYSMQALTVTDSEGVTPDAQRLGAVHRSPSVGFGLAYRRLQPQLPAGLGNIDKARVRADYGTAVLDVGCSS